MTKTIEFNETGEWTLGEAIELSMKEASMETEIKTMERRLKWSREIVKNRGKERAREQAKKEEQAMMNWDE